MFLKSLSLDFKLWVEKMMYKITGGTFVPVGVRNVPAFLPERTLSTTHGTNGLLFFFSMQHLHNKKTGL